jgi:hypothetical protein
MEDLRGLELARLFFEEAVAPVVASALPGRPYPADQPAVVVLRPDR